MIRKARISKIRNHITVSTTGHQVQSTYEVKQCCLNMLLSMRGWPLLILFAMTLGGCLGRPQHQLPDRYGGGGSGGGGGDLRQVLQGYQQEVVAKGTEAGKRHLR